MTATPSYRLVIFDMDGTLADSFPWFASVFNEVAERYRFKRIDAAEREALRALGSREILRYLGVPAWKLPLIARHFRARKTADLHRVTLFDGVDRLLRRLSAGNGDSGGIVTAIVSSDTEANVRRVLGPENAALIRWYGCSASIFGKPAKIRRVLRRSGVAPADAILIGDEVRDAEAAARTGIAFGAVSWGYAKPEALAAHAPLKLFATHDEIADFLA
ncbi:MAG TPA: HAD hydrolase-like protein [Stellaceae bacterium]